MHLAAWFESTSSFLGGRRPREVIPEDGAKVLETVRDLPAVGLLNVHYRALLSNL